MKMVYIDRDGYEQEPGRERVPPYYREQEERREKEGYRRSRNPRPSNSYRTYGYENARHNPMEPRSRRDYDNVRPIGFVPNMRMDRSGSYMHTGDGSYGEMERGRGSSMRMQPLSEDDAEEWVRGMKFSDGTREPQWDLKEVEKLLKEHGYDCDPIDIWVGMNALYSDLGEVNKKFGITSHHTEYWLEAACAFWLCDEDAVEEKLSAYYTYVVSK